VEGVPASALLGLRYARAAGVATGIFLILWTPFNAIRWGGQAPEWLLRLESVYFVAFGVLLALPWSRITGTLTWRLFFSGLCLLSAGFAFLMCIDLMFQYMLSTGELSDSGGGLYRLDAGKGRGQVAPPAFQSLLIFTSLMQVPAVYFVRHPHAMA